MSVRNNASGATREALTNEAGAFRFSGLPPSNYSLTVEFPGFRTVTRPLVTLAVGGTTKVDFQLNVGAVAESITVAGAVPLVQPTENTIQVVVKSGGNDIHGSGFYFMRDDAFDKDPFRVVRGEAVPDANPPPFQTRQYGFTIGGRFVRHKMFYFGSIERRTEENSSHVTIPDSVKAFVDSLNAGYDTSSALPRTVDERNALDKFTLNLSEAHDEHHVPVRRQGVHQQADRAGQRSRQRVRRHAQLQINSAGSRSSPAPPGTGPRPGPGPAA